MSMAKSYSYLNSLKISIIRLCRGGVEKFLLLLRKGVYPYEYMKNMSKFDEKELTTIDNFYSKLNSSGITTKD